MSVIIGSARIDENGHAHGGRAGDQTGREVSTQEFYQHSKGWIIARLKDPKAAEEAAKSMQRACDNKNIGYDQYQRYGVWNNGTGSKVKTEADCSSLVRTCIKEATGKDVGDIRTILMEKMLPASGLFYDLKQYKAGVKLYTGDILFTGILGHPVSGHTVIVVKGAARDDGGKARLDIAKPTLKQANVNKEVKVLQKDLNWVKSRDENGNKLVIDGEFGRHTKAALMNFQKKYELEVDGIYGPISAAKMDEVLN